MLISMTTGTRAAPPTAGTEAQFDVKFPGSIKQASKNRQKKLKAEALHDDEYRRRVDESDEKPTAVSLMEMAEFSELLNLEQRLHKLKFDEYPRQRPRPRATQPLGMPTDHDFRLDFDVDQWRSHLQRVVEYEEEWVRPLEGDIKSPVTVLYSGLGTGKTSSCGKLLEDPDALRKLVNQHTKFKLKHNEPVRVVFPTCRVSLANATIDNYPGLKDKLTFYSDESHLIGQYYVVQLESMFKKLKTQSSGSGCHGFHVVIADEIESLWLQLASMHTNRDMNGNKEMFECMMQECLVICCEAILTTRTIHLLTKICGPEKITLIINTAVKVPKEVVLYDGANKSFSESDSFKWRMIGAVAKNEPQVCVSGSAKELEGIKADLRDKVPELANSFKCYFGYSDDSEKADVCDPDSAWKSLKFLAYTGVITVGVSFNVKDCFSEINLYLSLNGSLYRDTLQGSMRVRHTKEQLLHIFVPKTYGKNKKPTTFRAIKKMFETKRSLLTDFENEVMARSDFKTDWFVDLLIWNKLERNLQLAYPMDRIKALLKQLNWSWALSTTNHREEDVVTPQLPPM
jgi:hypothetical protein